MTFPRRRRLQHALAADPDLIVAAGAPTASKTLAALEPSSLTSCLTSACPASTAWGVLDAILIERRPRVVFVTAYDRYAVRAFELRRHRLRPQAPMTTSVCSPPSPACARPSTVRSPLPRHRSAMSSRCCSAARARAAPGRRAHPAEPCWFRSTRSTTEVRPDNYVRPA